MKKDCGPRKFVYKILGRSSCGIQTAAVLTSKDGRKIHQWGWNSAGNGFGMCAEAHAIRRANPKRLKDATLTVAGRWKKTGNPVFCQPCEDCFNLAKAVGIDTVEHTNKNGDWVVFQLKYVKLNLKKLKRRK